MVKTGRMFIWLFLFISSCTFIGFAGGEAKPVPLKNSGFELVAGNGQPSNWSLATEGKPGIINFKVDNTNAYEGKKSIMLGHNNWARSTVVSELLDFKVGQLYRLSGYIKTEAAETRETDRYPTSVAACLTMESLPFTNHSPAVGGSSGWTKVDALFIATRSKDRVRFHLGYNGDARGKSWFDKIRVEKVEDITQLVPMETVRWKGPGFRYDDKGWIFVHIEGKPYERGYQYGYLVADEIVSYMKKLAFQTNNDDPASGWRQLRNITNAFLLKKYDVEYLTEMKGIADGAAKAGAKCYGSKLNLVDIVTVNTAIDLGQLWRALRNTPNALTGKSFLAAEDELNIPIREHKCSAFLANGPATPNGDIVFGQIFMWGGYTGVHWNVICDMVPSKGNRVVYQTYPGGINSGADFYVNSAGLMLGETTVSQTPYDMDGTPMSNRIRKAAQYANSIDDVAKILLDKNNGMYTNDWLIGDSKTNETAIFLLGTKKTKLWRSSTGEFPGGTKGFFWSNNNNKDNEVRKEYIPNADNAPYDLVFSPWNRDIAFNKFFKKHNGMFDSNAGVKLWASSPINRPHACDGKIITTEMAKEMVFLAHFGKVTLRGKFPAKGLRIMRDNPGATPHLSLGYSIISPKFVTSKLQALKKKQQQAKKKAVKKEEPKPDHASVKGIYTFNPRELWFNTVYPASEKENWFVSGTSSYWRTLKRMPKKPAKAAEYMKSQLSSLNAQLLYVVSREGTLAPVNAKRVYDRYNHYRIPRIRGIYLLHQLRLHLGNKTFSKLMNAVHNKYKDKPITNKQFIALASKVSGKKLKSFVMQWINRDTLPDVKVTMAAQQKNSKWNVRLKLNQSGKPYHFYTTVAVNMGEKTTWKKVEVKKANQTVSIVVDKKPQSVSFNAGNDIPVDNDKFYTFSNYFDDFDKIMFVYGTSRQIEANRTLTTRFRTMLANIFTEVLPPVVKDSEVKAEDLKNRDLVVIGGPADNRLSEELLKKLGIKAGKNFFQWQGVTYGNPEDGLMVTYPNPYNPKRVVYIFLANSALELHQMTGPVRRMPSWALFKGKKIVEKGFHSLESHQLAKK